MDEPGRVYIVARDHFGLVDTCSGGTDRTRRVEHSHVTVLSPLETVKHIAGVAEESRDYSSRIDA